MVKYYEKRYESLKHNKNFEKLTAEYLIISLAKNIQYFFLIFETLALLKLVDFRLGLKYLPQLSLIREWQAFAGHSYNPAWLYYRFIEIFFSISKGLIVNLWETVKQFSIESLLICFLIAGIWLTYTTMKYGYSKSESKRHNIFKKFMNRVLLESSLFERALWIMFFIDLFAFITTPTRRALYLLLIVYGLLLSIKFIPKVSHALIKLTQAAESSLLQNKYLIAAVIAIDIALIYFDSSIIFAIFSMVLLYCVCASIAFYFSKGHNKLRQLLGYVFNLGMLILLVGVLAIYYICFTIVSLIISPLHIYVYAKKGKLASSEQVAVATACITVLLTAVYLW